MQPRTDDTLAPGAQTGMAAFRAQIYAYYHTHGRRLPWRETHDPYHILVSEIMLQQTQVERVLIKYPPFIAAFPTLQALAGAPLRDVLGLWQGLGYNRRALALKAAAQMIMDVHGGALPDGREALRGLPGIGAATAGSIQAFAFHMPAVFIETNIRRVFIHHFFAGQENVRDAEILPLAEAALDRQDPRNWYYALMDYGVMLKKSLPNPNRRSAHYQRQAPFEDSERQVRGLIIKTLLAKRSATDGELSTLLDIPAARIKRALQALAREGLVMQNGKEYRIADKG